MKEPEYQEGPKAKEDFERTMVALFRAPKPKAKENPKRGTSARKTKRSDKD
jgi:hypothetical protein